MNDKKSFNGNPQPVKKDEVLYPDVPKDIIAEDIDFPINVKDIKEIPVARIPDFIKKDMLGTMTEMKQEIERIENLNNICRAQLRNLKPAMQQIEGYEDNLKRNIAMIEYIEYRMNLLKQKK